MPNWLPACVTLPSWKTSSSSFSLERHHGGVENVQSVVGAIGNPEFLFIGTQSDAMARATVAIQWASLPDLRDQAIPSTHGVLFVTGQLPPQDAILQRGSHN